jgi:hypothetical protein
MYGKPCSFKIAIFLAFFIVIEGVLFHNDFHRIADSNLVVSDRFSGIEVKRRRVYIRNIRNLEG